jgi:hypothetical protein
MVFLTASSPYVPTSCQASGTCQCTQALIDLKQSSLLMAIANRPLITFACLKFFTGTRAIVMFLQLRGCQAAILAVP